jgi:hypothetical protein
VSLRSGPPRTASDSTTPTAWTRRVQPSCLDFARVACETVASAGAGAGGATATFRLSMGERSETSFRDAAPSTATAVLGLDGVSSVLVGVARPEVTRVRTRESELRGDVDDRDVDAVALVDGIDEASLVAALPTVRHLLQTSAEGVTVDAACLYALSFLLMSGAAEA